MKQIKLIVSNKSKLLFKYGTGVKKINAALKQMQAADKKKGLDTRIIFVDDAASLHGSGVKKIHSDLDKEYKRVVDDLYKKFIPAYIVILGSPDVFPFQEIDNPAEDEDDVVESDLPYACDKPYSKKIDNFTGPTRVVGRIPDYMGKQKDPFLLEKLIKNAYSHKAIKADKYFNYFAITASVWRQSTEMSLQSMFGGSKMMINSPDGKSTAAYKSFTKKQLAPLTHFYNCHGANFDFSFYGQKGKKFPEAMQSANVPQHITPGTIVAAECCYGAQLFDESKAGLTGKGIAINYLANDAIAFLGSSTIAYGPADAQGLADLLTQYFIKQVLKGSSAGKALLEARQRFLTEMGPDLDPVELKTIAQFYLLGDPSVQPAECEEAEVVKLTAGAAMANSRKNLYMKGITLGESIGTTRKQRRPSSITGKMPLSGTPGVTAAEILAKNNFKPADKNAVYNVQSKANDNAGLQKKFGGKDVKFHSYIQNPREHIKKIRVLVIKENSSQILGWRVYESR